ncbi:TPA: DUF4113 domain-containing protein [Vibrio parahaemolyticus]|nr:DUF4113 domain-containing protein [Vibrio parahaemolyticus]HAS6487662.1 DUF4113 domain-containing protein [Vibrio parahaemolyticus]
MLCFAASSPFDEKPASFKTIHRFSFPTSDVTHLSQVASNAADELFREGVRFYKIGVGFLDLSDRTMHQLDMLNENPSNEKLNAVFDGLNRKYGTDAVFIAAQGIKQEWSMKRQLLSKQYTTKWSDLPKISCS